MKTFRFHWFDGKVETGNGYNVSDAFTRLGYTAGALAVLDFYEEI
jgi:hypothetical protein